VFIYIYIVLDLPSDAPRRSEYREGGVVETTGKIANSNLRKTASVIEVEPLNVHQSTHTSCSLPWYFRSVPVDNTFATNVSYSVGHLTSIL